MKKAYLLFILACIPLVLFSENGYQLWMRYPLLPTPCVQFYQKTLPSYFLASHSETSQIIRKELDHAFVQMTGKKIRSTTRKKEASLVFQINTKMKSGYSLVYQNKVLQITASDDINLLYGMYHLLRLIQTQQIWNTLNIIEHPSYDRRILNHWDNMDGSIERGYAGHSIWNWDDLPQTISSRYLDYARANASIGINGSVLNNVNANPLFLSNSYLKKIAALAHVFHPYGIQVYLSINFSSPMALDHLSTSDPLNPEVIQWWKNKVNEIYRLIPNFGGFLVKANSEGLPGPQDYGRTHAEGANMLADALAPHHGIVMWRAFVYNASSNDRAKQAYDEFKPLDGAFRNNVIIQVKNGPIDFQPREPFSPLFGALKKTPLMLEFQITQEYLGFSNQLAYLAPLYAECLNSDTYSQGQGSTVAKNTDGTLIHSPFSAIAGVANIGRDSNWCGHPFAQANWYAFGRLAWNDTLSSSTIADDWLRMTFSNNDSFVAPVKEIMMESREAVVSYMMPLGLHHLFAWGHHYGPEPWCNIPHARPDWLPSYYHKADSLGIGFNRTSTGSDAVSQYNEPLSSTFNNIKTCPENLLLWFHHVSWNYTMKDGKTVWDELCYKYTSGVDTVRSFQKVWDEMAPYIDEQRFKQVQYKLKIQTKDALWWRDACLLYFQTFSNQAIPFNLERPIHDLEELKLIKLNLTHHN